MLLVHVPQFNLCRVELSYIGKMRNGGMIWIQIVQCVYLCSKQEYVSCAKRRN